VSHPNNQSNQNNEHVNNMKKQIKNQILCSTLSLAAFICLLVWPANGQFGGLGKKLPGIVPSGGGVDISADVTAINQNLTPASKLLEEASALYQEALGLKKEAAKGKVKQSDLPDLVPTQHVVKDEVPAIQTRMEQWNQQLNEEQKQKCGQAHAKLTEGTAALALVAAPTALAIKKVTDSDPKGMLLRPDLASLGLLCAKDSAKLMSFVKVATDFNKKWDAPISTTKIPENKFVTN